MNYVLFTIIKGLLAIIDEQSIMIQELIKYFTLEDKDKDGSS